MLNWRALIVRAVSWSPFSLSVFLYSRAVFAFLFFAILFLLLLLMARGCFLRAVRVRQRMTFLPCASVPKGIALCRCSASWCFGCPPTAKKTAQALLLAHAFCSILSTAGARVVSYLPPRVSHFREDTERAVKHLRFSSGQLTAQSQLLVLSCTFCRRRQRKEEGATIRRTKIPTFA